MQIHQIGVGHFRETSEFVFQPQDAVWARLAQRFQGNINTSVLIAGQVDHTGPPLTQASFDSESLGACEGIQKLRPFRRIRILMACLAMGKGVVLSVNA